MIKTLFILTIALCSMKVETNDLGFDKILKKDKQRLATEHFLGNTTELKKFDKVVSLDLNKYKYSINIFGKHKIEKWITKDPNQKCQSVLKITTTIKLDTTIFENGLKSYPTFIFKTFSFSFAPQKGDDKLVYLTLKDQGLLRYSVGKKEYGIAYESVFVGFDDIYFDTKKEIYKLLETN